MSGTLLVRQYVHATVGILKPCSALHLGMRNCRFFSKPEGDAKDLFLRGKIFLDEGKIDDKSLANAVSKSVKYIAIHYSSTPADARAGKIHMLKFC